MTHPVFRSFATALSLAAVSSFASADVQPDAVLLRYPDISATEVVFRFDGDLWLVSKEGGLARRLTSVDGNENFAKFSPDGKQLAFMGGYDGGSDLYVLDIAAGIPSRVTHHPGSEILCDWTPDGDDLLYWSSEVSGLRRASRILRVPASGGQPTPLPVPYGAFGSIDSSGTWLAYTLGSREFRTWKRYHGGMAQDVWLFNLETNESRRITDHEGTDSMPMWHGRDVVFLSDRASTGRLNLYAYNVDSGETRALTRFESADVKFPSMGPDDVVFEAGGKLYRYEFASDKNSMIEVQIPGERPHLRKRTHDVKGLTASAMPGPGGVRVAIEARGDIFTVPVEEGVTRNLTRTDGVAERSPSWSPDGKWVCYFSDRSGEYELTLRRANGKTFEGADDHGEKKLTSIGPGWKYSPRWSPDSEKIAFAKNDGSLHVYDMESGELSYIHTNPDGNPLQFDWSHDAAWLTWSHRHSASRLEAIYLYDVAAGETHEVTSGMFNDSNPVFDRDGNWLFFTSSRTFSPIYEDMGTTWIYTNTSQLMAVPLRADVENPWAVEDNDEEVEEDEDGEEEGDEEGADDDESEEGDAEDGAEGEAAASEEDAEGDDTDEGDDEEGDEDAEGEDDEEEEEEEPLQIDLEGFEARVIMLPVDGGNVGNLEGGHGKVAFVRSPRTGSDDSTSTLFLYAMEDKEEKEILSGLAGGYVPTAKGDKLLVFNRGEMGVIDFAPGQKFEAIDRSGLVVTIDPRNEWKQLLDDVHRLFRDFFYEPTLHSVDWDGIHARYLAALPDVTSRGDIDTMISEMIAELNVGHAYNRGWQSDDTSGSARPVGLLGCDWALENGAYRITRILGDAGPYDADARSPLSKLGVDAKAGDYLLEVNGLPVDTSRSVYAAFEGTAGKATEITLNAEPTMDGEERHVLVKPVRSESSMRYRDWVAHKRAMVEEAGGGRIGYVHVPDTGVNGQNELVRQFMGQMHKDALIVDERWNGGGQIPTRFIELLNRPVTNYWAIRHGEDWEWPPVGHRGPKAMLINGWSGSGGDAFPYYFRQSGLGPLIGRRTWGGLVGISGNPNLIDGSGQAVPRFAFYELDGTWGVEGYGVAPDMEVWDDPSEMVDGGDPQLEAAITHLLGELERNPPVEVPRPASPDRSGTGPITPEDR